MILSSESLQLLFIDALFICLAAVLALWFRAWIKTQQRSMDRRLADLEAHSERFERIATRLQSACRSVENFAKRSAADAQTRSLPTVAEADGERGRGANSTYGRQAVEDREEGSPVRRTPAKGPPGVRASLDREAPHRASAAPISGTGFARARDLLDQGVPVKEVAERLGMGLAEIDALKRMMEYGPRAAAGRSQSD